MNYRELWQVLVPRYGEREAQAVVRLLLDHVFGLSLADVLAGGLDSLPVPSATHLQAMMQRLMAGEPVQYVMGEAEFCGRWLKVSPAVLIPRPETEELCQWVLSAELPAKPRILDIGTGSGCIACTLAAELPDARVEGWDISEEALLVARENAGRIGVHAVFSRHDILATADILQGSQQKWDVIVSNPPYICQKERATMAPHVLQHEPATALFVPDDDALCFYRAIATYALAALDRGGRLFFEINPLYAEELQAMLLELAFCDVSIRIDAFGRQRFISAIRP